MEVQAWIKKGKEKLLSLGVRQWGMLLLAGVCLLVIVFPMEKQQEEKTSKENESVKSTMDNRGTAEMQEENDFVAQQEKKLSALLSAVKDAGKVQVMITVDRSVQKNVLQDGSTETEQLTETDSAGGSRTSVSEKKEGTTVFYDIQGETTPYILSEAYPQVIGVVVLAQGSGTGTVDLDILHAVQVLFDLPAHKIKIMKMK